MLLQAEYPFLGTIPCMGRLNESFIDLDKCWDQRMRLFMDFGERHVNYGTYKRGATYFLGGINIISLCVAI